MTTYTNPTNDREKALRQLGYTGPFGEGGDTAWLTQNPMIAAQLQPLMTGMADPQFMGGGVTPVGFVEPLNEWQKQGLTGLADPLSAGNNMFGLAAGSLAGVPGDLQAARAPLSGTDYSSRVSEYLNPYTDQVLNRTIDRLNTAGQEARARIMASQGFRQAFGDTSLGVQQSELDKNLMNSIGDATANLSYKGYDDASTKALEALTGERNRSLATAQGLGNLSSLASGLGSVFDTRQMQNNKNLLGAGTAVQQQNQAQLDVLNPELKGVQNYPVTNLQQLAEFLKAFPSTTNSNFATTDPNMASRLGSAGTFLGGLDWSKLFG